MDENQSTSSSENSGGGNKNLIVMAIVAVVVIALLIGGAYYFLYMSKPQDNTEVVDQQTTNPDAEVEGTSEETAAGNYQDGTYTATGTYSYHSGEESVEVTVTLESGAVTEAKVVSKAIAPTSKTMQADFIANFESMVIGKNIDEVRVGKVSGSSLTGVGFNAAIEDIKEQAQG